MHSNLDLPFHTLSKCSLIFRVGCKLLISISTLLSFSVLTEQASADGKFIYQAGEIEYWRQVFSIDPAENPDNPQVADINGDGATDVIYTGFADHSITDGPRGPLAGLILLNNGDNTFTVAEGDVPNSENVRQVLVADFNGDEIPDVYFADHGFDVHPFPGFKNQLLLGTGTGFTDVSDRLPDIAAFTHNAAIGDVDQDGDIDILVLNTDFIEEELSYLLINDGSANFTLNRQRLPASLTTLDQIGRAHV